jgi:DNA helicase HerA-like ATPase
MRTIAYRSISMEPIGVIFGNVRAGTFKVAVSDTNVQRNEYVQVNHKMYGPVLGQIARMERETDVDYEKASQISGGEDVEFQEKLVGTVDIIGYRDDRGILQKPQTPFAAGEVVVRAENDLVKSVLGLRPEGGSTAYMGLLQGYNIRVNLDINELVSRHMAILSKTGGGKSYTVGVFIEELIKRLVPVVVIDPHGEYSSLMFPNVSERDHREMKRFGVKPRGYGEHIAIFSPDTKTNKEAIQISFDSINPTEEDLGEFLDASGTANKRLLADAVRRVKEGRRFYTIEQVLEALMESTSEAKWVLVNKLEMYKEMGLFSQTPTRLSDMVKEGQTTIIDLKGSDGDLQEVLVNRIIRKLFEARKLGKIPPMMLVAEEAHNFCPQQGAAKSSATMRTVAAEGRKFGLGMCAVTQRPAKIDKNVLSQCATQIILKITSPNDLKVIAQSIEGFTEGMEDDIQALPIGVALVTGGSLSRPMIVEIRVRETKHGGEGVSVISAKAKKKGKGKAKKKAEKGEALVGDSAKTAEPEGS